MELALLILGLIILIFTIVMIPIQIHYFQELDKIKKEKNVSQQELYDSMPFESMYLHFITQSHLFMILPNIIAYMIYKWMQRQNKEIN
jgi:Protein of unknown function (DUF3949)